MPSLRHASPRRPRRGAQRRARRRRDREAPWHAPGRGRSRAAAAQPAGTGASAVRCGGRHRPIPPSCVTTTTPSLFNGYGCGCGPQLAQFRPGFLRPPVLQRKVRYAGIHAPTFRRYSSATPLDVRAAVSPIPPPPLSEIDATRRRRYVDVPGPIGTGSPTSPAEPVSRRPRRRSRCRFSSVAVPRALPGFSGSFQVYPPLYLQVCECRHSN